MIPFLSTSTGAVASKIYFTISYGTLSVCICFYNNIRHSLMKWLSFVALLTLYLLILVALTLEFAIRSHRP